jgi:CheY-like chemotaxis protein
MSAESSSSLPNRPITSDEKHNNVTVTGRVTGAKGGRDDTDRLCSLNLAKPVDSSPLSNTGTTSATSTPTTPTNRLHQNPDFHSANNSAATSHTATLSPVQNTPSPLKSPPLLSRVGLPLFPVSAGTRTSNAPAAITAQTGTVAVPISARTATVPVRATATTTATIAAATTTKCKPRILLAEDQVINQKLVRAMLKDQCEVKTVANGLEAVNAVSASYQPDLVLMDINMPVMGGYEATLKLRAQGFNGPIVAVTANALAVCDSHLFNFHQLTDPICRMVGGSGTVSCCWLYRCIG